MNEARILLQYEGVSCAAAAVPVSFAVAEGEWVCLHGGPRLERARLLHALLGACRLHRGCIRYRGEDISGGETSRRVKERVGFCFEEYGLIGNLSVYENVMLPAWYRGMDDRESAVRDLLARFGLDRVSSRRPADIGAEEVAGALVVRAFACDPELVLIDFSDHRLAGGPGHGFLELLHESSAACLAAGDEGLGGYRGKTWRVEHVGGMAAGTRREER